MLKKFSLSILLSLIFLSALAYPIYASNPFWRVLDTKGDGTGTINATGNYTGTLAPRVFLKSASNLVLTRLIVNVEDSAVITYNYYGGITVTTGVVVRKVSGANVVTLTQAITNNLQWRRYCDVTTTTGQATNQLQAICPLDNVTLAPSERLEVLMKDDYSGLDGNYFIVEGYVP